MLDFVLPRGANEGSTNLALPRDNLPQHMVIAAFTGIAWYNCLELDVNVYMTFKRKTGLYFWAIVLCIQGVFLHSLAFILKFYLIVPQFEITCTIITIGWYLMVTGQAVVLYSRLHLIVNNPMIIRGVLIMIIWNAITLHIPTTVLTYGSNSSNPGPYAGFATMEKIQLIIFSCQELIISSIYIWATLKRLRPAYRKNIRSVMLQLLWINVIIILMDATLVMMEFLGFYYVEATMKSAIYSVKLKLEFAVLNQLMRITKSSRDRHVISDQSQQISSTGMSSNHGGPIRTWVRKVFPVPSGSRALEDGKNHESIVLQSTGSVHNAQRRMVASNTKEGLEGQNPPSNGIAMTTEILQVTSTGRGGDKGGSEVFGYDRKSSLDMVGDGVGSDQSQVELVTLPSSHSFDETPRESTQTPEVPVKSLDPTTVRGWPAR